MKDFERLLGGHLGASGNLVDHLPDVTNTFGALRAALAMVEYGLNGSGTG